MTSNEKTFILEVSQNYTTYPCSVDEYFDIIVSVQGQNILISQKIFSAIFKEYSRSSMTRGYAIQKALKAIQDAVDKYISSMA